MPSIADDLFPPSPRVIYEKAPLVEVICQLRFPTLLSIESQAPVAFQEQVRGVFPLFERPKDLSATLGQVPQEILQLVGAQGTGYQFFTEDRASNILLRPNSLSLTTTKYERWENFRGQLRGPLAALVEIYKPSFFQRIGLRYRDAIDRSRLGLSGSPWSQLIQQRILGELSLPQFEANLENIFNRAIRVKLPDGSGSVLMQHGLGNVQGRAEINYIIDFDFFTEHRTEVQNAEPTLNHFNAKAGSAFRWCITDRLSDALGPRQLAAVG